VPTRSVEVGPGVPDVEVAHGGELGHRPPVALGQGERDAAAGLAAESVLPAGHGQAGREPLHVPLPRPRRGLVEVVDVEDQAPLRRAEQPEVQQVRVAAELGGEPGGRAGREVGGHHGGRATQERERRQAHPPVADRHQLGQPAGVLRLQDADRVRAIGGGGVLGVALRRHQLPRVPPGRGADLGIPHLRPPPSFPSRANRTFTCDTSSARGDDAGRTPVEG
jgi:hypothetical protein